MAIDGEEINLPQSAQRVVAYLALVGTASRQVIATRLWPDLPIARALNSLRSALHRLARGAVGAIRRGGDRLWLAKEVQVDIHAVIDWAQGGLAAPDATPQVPPPSAFRDELLPGWFDDWVLQERDYLHHMRLLALERYAQWLCAEERFAQALHAAHRIVRSDPLRESAYRILVGIHLAQGNVVDALRLFDRFRALLLAELGIEPTEQMVALIAPYRRQRARRRDGAGIPRQR